MFEFLRQIGWGFWATLAEMSPYLLFGFFVAGVMAMFVSRRMVERHLGGSGVMPIFKASLFGVPLPLCSCGVIPVAMSLSKQGASKGATVAFLLSTPQTGVDSILVTYSLLGPVFAIFRPLAALVTGFIGGILVNVFGAGPEAAGRRLEVGGQTTEGGGRQADPVVPLGKRIVGGLKHGFVTLPRNIGKPLLIGLVVAGVISALVPDDFFADRLGKGLPAMLVMMVIGIPIYVCASASVPVAAALILKGLSPGAALVFLMTGPATNAAGLTTIWNALGRRTAVLYLGTVAACSLIGGFLLDSLISNVDVQSAVHIHNTGPALIQQASAVVLLAILGYAFFAPKHD